MSPKVPIAAWTAVVLIYFITCSPYLAPADSPEFVALMVHGGFAHAPGSPTTVLLYRLFSWLPFDPPLAASFATALFGGAAVAMLYRACRAWGFDRAPATAAMVLVGLHSQVWLVHTHPEAFVINDMFAAAILWLAAPHAAATGTARVALLGVLAGVGLGAHQSLVLLAPIGLWGVYRGVTESERAWLALILGALLLVGGFCVYGTMMLWDSPVSFGRIETFDQLVHHVLRKDYGTMSLSAQGTAGPLDQLPFWIAETFVDSGVVGLALLFVGLTRAVREAGEQRGSWLALVGTWVLCGPLFIAILNINPEGPRAEMVKRFHVLPWLVSAPLLAVGARWLLDTEVARRIKIGVGVATLAMLLLVGLHRTSHVYSGALEDSLRNTLRTLPKDAVIFGQGDHRYFGFQYLQLVEQMRPDVVAIEASTMGYDWYVDRLRERLDLQIPHAGDRIALDGTLDAILERTERPVFVTRDFAEKILEKRRMVPEGPAWRLLRDGEPEPSADELYRHTADAFEQFEHNSDPPQYLYDPWGWSLFHVHTRIWDEIAKRCQRESAPCVQPALAMLQRYPDL